MTIHISFEAAYLATILEQNYLISVLSSILDNMTFVMTWGLVCWFGFFDGLRDFLFWWGFLLVGFFFC